MPIVATIVGEGGSGGALALALADRVLMLEHSVYSVASPEGAAAILWGDAARAEEAATRLKLTSDDLLAFGIVDEVIPEPIGGAHRDAAGTDRVASSTPSTRALDALVAGAVGRAARRAATASSAASEPRRERMRPVRFAVLFRQLGRLGVVCVALVALSLIGVQYARLIGRNIALAHELRDVERDVATLKAKRAQQQRDIRRLSDPRGAIPEIHDRLHLVGDKEAIIYLKRGTATEP